MATTICHYVGVIVGKGIIYDMGIIRKEFGFVDF